MLGRPNQQQLRENFCLSITILLLTCAAVNEYLGRLNRLHFASFAPICGML